MGVIEGDSEGCVVEGDCLALLKSMAGKVDLVFGSPPYEDCRTYGIDFALKGQAWVDWMRKVVRASLCTCNGLVAFVVCGKVADYEYSAVPEMLMADLKRAGIALRRPPIFHRVGIPGSGGPDWWRNDYEIVVCATRGGRLSWSDNTATGEPPKFGPGGAPSHRTRNGSRVCDKDPEKATQPTNRERRDKSSHRARRDCGQPYKPPAIANPGNVIDLGAVGGGAMGSPLAHKNEAPFPEELADAFVRSFCPPGGIVLDPFSGSGTTCAVARKTGRRFIGIDIRECQVELAKNRLRDTPRNLFAEAKE